MAHAHRTGLVRPSSERGAILIIAVILVVVTVGLAAAMLVAANALTERAIERASIDRARDLAEEGIDLARLHLLSLIDPRNFDDPAAAWDEVLASEGGVPARFRGGVTTKEGSYAIRVVDNEDGDGDLTIDRDMMVIVESTGTAAGQGRTIRAVVRCEPYDPTAEFAILTEDNLYIWGNQTTDGTLANVHTNKNLYVWGSPDIHGIASASEQAWGWGNYRTEGGTVNGPLHDNSPVVPIPPVEVAAYRSKMEYVLTRDGRVLDGNGRVLWQADQQQYWRTDFRGIQWSPWGWYTHHGSNPQDGSYYIEGNFWFTGGGRSGRPWNATIVAEGYISGFGNPIMTPRFGNELLVSGGDLWLHGTGWFGGPNSDAAEMQGILLSHRSVSLSGNVSLRGRVVAEANRDGLPDWWWWGLTSYFGGSVRITYDGGVTRSLTTSYRIPVKSWQEELVTNADATTQP